MAGKTVTEVFEHYYQGMLHSLPMNNANFLVVLNEQGLLPVHVQSFLETLDESIERASYLLDHVIKPDIDVCFNKLLTIMAGSDFDNMRDLATKIKFEMLENDTEKLSGTVIGYNLHNKITNVLLVLNMVLCIPSLLLCGSQ